MRRIALNAETLTQAYLHPGSLLQSGIHRVISELVDRISREGGLSVELCDEAVINFADGGPLAQAMKRRGVDLPVASVHASLQWLGNVRRVVKRKNDAMHERYPRRHLFRIMTSVLWRAALMCPPRQLAIQGRFNLYHGFLGALHAKSVINADHRLVTMFDAIPSRFPQWCDRHFVDDWHRMVVGLDGSRDHVACISASCRDDVSQISGFPRERMAIIYLGVNQVFKRQSDAEVQRVRAAYRIPDGPYFLGVGTIEPRKNLESLVRAMRLMPSGPSAPMLVLAGAKGWMMERFLADVASDQSLAARVRITGFVADADLPALYSGAMAFVFPSLYEGFGLPPLEAMACGAPVICSNTSSLPEVVGDAALTVSPTDVAALSDAMRQVAGSHALQEDLGQRGMHRATEFTWERTTRQYMELYSSLCEGHGVPEHLREVGI